MNTKTTTKTRISLLLPNYITEEIKKVTREKNVTQSFIIKEALEAWMQKKLEKDTKELSEMDFNDLPKEEEWLSIQSKTV
ncbi:hypothetical protein ISS03_05850 [Patescibacteria group bacterium]|nr:hypothetical protein [Patescibacteria group bacterium]